MGHAGEGVEIVSRDRLITDLIRLLQLGHAGEGVEIVTPVLCLAPCLLCFNWATPVKAWR